MKKFLLTMLAVSSLALAGCETTTGGSGFTMNKQTMGTGIGALAGGLAGSQVGSGSGQLWATGAGVLLGSMVGSSVGASLDKADLMYAQRASSQAHAAPIGEQISWNNPQSGNSGTITPVRDGYSSSNRYCREYQQTITVGGRRETAYGTACQSPNGDWQIID
jgi:surface antigen